MAVGSGRRQSAVENGRVLSSSAQVRMAGTVHLAAQNLPGTTVW